METAMSDLFDKYPVLLFSLEALVPVLLLAYVVIYVSSGKKKKGR